MANDLNGFLELAKQANDIVKNNATVPQSRNNFVDEGTIVTRDNFDQRMSELDDLVFGKLEESKKKQGYSAEEEMERIKNRANERVNANITNPILQEVINNPYQFDIETMMGVCSPRMRKLEEKLSKQNFSQSFGGIEKAKAITETLDGFDKQKKVVSDDKNPNESAIVHHQAVSSVDYEMIKMIVENAIDKKLAQLGTLNENKQYKGCGKNPIIMLGENSFTFVDESGNMYECSGMKYKGKMKLRKK